MGEFEEQDAAVVQAWHERDVEDAEYYAHRFSRAWIDYMERE